MLEIEGIVISEIKYGETSKIINVLANDNKIYGIYCKGANLLKSKFKINLMMYAKFFIKKKDDKLANLNDITLINNFKNIQKDIIKIGYANYLLDLIKQVNKEGTSDFLFSYLLNSLEKINNGLNPKIITSIVELKLLNNLGVAPNLDSCVNCGDKKSIVTISSYAGGYLCDKCLKNEKIVSEKTIKLIRLLYFVDIEKIDNIDIKKDVETEVSNFIDDYYDRYTGLYLQSKTFLKSIVK